MAAHDTLRIVAHDEQWAQRCADEAEAIRVAITPARAFIDHVGSTAIHGLRGKPVIDLLVSLVDWSEAPRVAEALKAAGYIEEESCDRPPRVFLVKVDPVTPFNLHLVPNGSPWGRDMIVFRDELSGDPALASRYATLKERLAKAFPIDANAYTEGKSSFVAEVLRRAAGSFGIDRLLTHQRAELNHAQTYQNLALASQFGIAAVAAISVYSSDNATLLNFALIGFGLGALWLWMGSKQRKHRSAGDQARRAVLLTSGLNARFSAEQRLRIFDHFTAPIENRPMAREENYFASRAEPSYCRLAELIEESAYWTRDLQRASAQAMRLVLVGVALLMGFTLWHAMSSMSTDTQVSLARVLVAALVFLVSSDTVGAMISHKAAADAIDDVLQRVESAAARGYPEQDLLLLLVDYNAIVEGAPVALPGIYQLRRGKLTRRWRAYLENKRTC